MSLHRRQWLLAAALAPAPPAAGRVAVHGLYEAEWEGGAADDPLAVRAAAVIRTPSGGRDTIPLFWDGGRRWRLRYSPENSGVYEITIDSSDPGLHGRRTRFSASGPSEATVLDREGAPRVRAGRRHFEHASGKPWFWLADTAWNGALLATEQEWDSYLDTRAGQRFTAIQFVLTQWRAGLADEQGRTAFQLEKGRLTIDPLFFARMDRRVAAIRARGLVPVPVMLWALSSKGDQSPGIILDVPQAIRLAAYLNARYAAYGALWMLGGDGDYRGENAQRWKEIGRGVFSGITRRPVTLHPRGMQDPWGGLKDESWLDFLTYQSGHGQDPKKWKWQVEEMPKGALLEPPRPVIDAEPNYEAHLSYRTRETITDYHVRRASYTSLLLSPVAGVTYGAHGVWPWLRKREVPLNHPGSGEGDPFFVCLKYPGAAQMKVLRDVFDRLEWWSLRPAPEIVRANQVDAGYGNVIVAARTASGREALVYIPSGAPVALDLSGWKNPVKPVWIDPKTGTSREGASISPGSGITLEPPASGDWLIHLAP
jgi:hypothetical protein